MSIPVDGYRQQTKATRIDGPIPKNELQQTARRFQSLYENGVAFFYKQHMRSISRQLADATISKTASSIRVYGLDGEPVDFEVQIGKISPSFHHGVNHIACVLSASSWPTPRLITV
jgi:hypothetical protein